MHLHLHLHLPGWARSITHKPAHPCSYAGITSQRFQVAVGRMTLNAGGTGHRPCACADPTGRSNRPRSGWSCRVAAAARPPRRRPRPPPQPRLPSAALRPQHNTTEHRRRGAHAVTASQRWPWRPPALHRPAHAASNACCAGTSLLRPNALPWNLAERGGRGGRSRRQPCVDAACACGRQPVPALLPS